MNVAKRLIEVALPIREISAESDRDKALRQGHISTLHVWWARRPLAACRAVVFASLVPDPDDPSCPRPFRDVVEKFLKRSVPNDLKHYVRGKRKIDDSDPYRPYKGIPDTLRNRLQMFVAKWSPESIAFQAGASEQEPGPSRMLDDRCLAKWEIGDPDSIQGRAVVEVARSLLRALYPTDPPVVLDPFAGGGAIPLEAGRLGCRPIANDLNPVAHLLVKASCEFPERFAAKAHSSELADRRSSETNLVRDIQSWWERIVEGAKRRAEHFYPPGRDGKPIVGYLWAREVDCSNPACRAPLPLLKSNVVCDLRNRSKRIAVEAVLDRPKKSLRFAIRRNEEIVHQEGTMRVRGNVQCLFCEQITPYEEVRASAARGAMRERMIAVIVETNEGKDYREVEPSDSRAFEDARSTRPKGPTEPIEGDNRYMAPPLYGMKTWSSMFNARQLCAALAFSDELVDACRKIREQLGDGDYSRALALYLALSVDRVIQRGSNIGVWHTGQETFEHPFGRQAVAMVWDYPEANPFSKAAQNTMSPDALIAFLQRESGDERQPRVPAEVMLDDAASLEFDGLADVTVTDPPYFDAIAYADLSDYFYVWLKRSLADVFPSVFATPLTPKAKEATALKHRHGENLAEAENYFAKALGDCLLRARMKTKPDGLVAIMFAHQSSKAWTALVNAIFAAGLTVNSTYAIDTEKTYGLKSTKSVLASSITVVCRPRKTGTVASFASVKKEIEKVVKESVQRFWDAGIRGADLLVACYGPAVGEFGKYERVERADGRPVEVPELLELARKTASNAIAGEFSSDPVSALYYVWANLYGAEEQDWDDARLVTQVGGGKFEDGQSLPSEIFIRNGQKCRLALMADRREKKALGFSENAPLIDQLHRAMILWSEEKRSDLVAFLSSRDLGGNAAFWKLAQSLFECLPRDGLDRKTLTGLLTDHSSLQAETIKDRAQRPERVLSDFAGKR